MDASIRLVGTLQRLVETARAESALNFRVGQETGSRTKNRNRPQDRTKLRSLAVRTLLSADVRPTGAIPVDAEVADICFTSDGTKLLIAESKRGWELSILVYDVKTSKLVRTVSTGTFAGNMRQLLQGNKKFQEGLRVIAISPETPTEITGDASLDRVDISPDPFPQLSPSTAG